MTVKTAVRHDAILGGLGGKGVLTIGQLIAEVGMKRFQHVLYLPAHGLFMRGGLAECSVIISDEKIASLLLSQAEAVLVLEPTVLKQFEQRVQPGGILIVEIASHQGPHIRQVHGKIPPLLSRIIGAPRSFVVPAVVPVVGAFRPIEFPRVLQNRRPLRFRVFRNIEAGQ